MPDEARVVVVNTTPLIALFIHQIRRGGIRLSDAVVEEALKLAGEESES